MYEDSRKFSWTGFFIKMIIIILFILFTVWLLSLSTKGLSRSLDVLTDNVFEQNIEKMKNVGKDYFTTERLPEKIGEVKTLTLSKMYDKKLILELKDKNGKACSAKNSYVSIEKMENEYQMKVYLECGEESDYIIVIMGCYSYCDSDICEKREDVVVDDKAIEYEYSKTTGGSWGPWGSWSDWSKVSVTKTNYRDVETKVVQEEYTYDKEITETVLVGDAKCETLAGYDLISSDRGVCTYKKTLYTDPIKCPALSGWNVTQDGFNCTYTKKTAVYTDPDKCPALSGWDLVQDGFNCTYTRKVKVYTDPDKCPALSGWDVTQDGFNCTYTRKNTVYVDPKECPTLGSEYRFISRVGFDCNYKKTVTSTTEYDIVFAYSGNGYPPSDTAEYHYEIASSEYVYTCTPTCGGHWVYTYNAYKKVYKTTTEDYTQKTTCPSGYTPSGNRCASSSTETKTSTVGCSVGTRSGNRCLSYKTETKTSTVGCSVGTRSGNRCLSYRTDTKTSTVDCPTGYNKVGNTCTKVVKTTKPAVCGSGLTMKDGKCYKTTTSTITIVGTRDVTYYRYRLREYVGGITDYKWSSSNNDKTLLDAGYKLTGRTREKQLGGK